MSAAYRKAKIKEYYVKKAHQQKAAVMYPADEDDPMTRVIRRDLSHMEMIGCNRAFLRKHLEKNFKEGMSWDNYAEWQVDHVVGICNWDLRDRQQRMKCFNYINLQPLWWRENLEKAKRVDRAQHP